MASIINDPLSREDMERLRIIDSTAEWTPVKDCPNTVISRSLSLKEARGLADKLNTFFLNYLKDKTSFYTNDGYGDSAYICKQASSDPKKYYVIFRRDKISMILQGGTLRGRPAKRRSVPYLSLRAKETCFPNHPVKVLNERRVDDEKTIQNSLNKQLERCKKAIKFDCPHSLPTSKCTMKTEAFEKKTPLSIGVCQSAGMREYQKDSYTFTSIAIKIGEQTYSLPVLAVFDGHSHEKYPLSGKQCADLAARRLPEILQARLQQEWSSSQDAKIKIFNALKLSFVEVSREIYRTTIKEDSGTTATLSFLIDQELWTAWAGDSGAIISTPNGVVPLTWDHRPVNQLKTNSSCRNRGGDIIKGRCGFLSFSHALGHTEIHQEEPKPDEVSAGVNPRCKITRIPLKDLPEKQNNYLVIASDGLWKVLSKIEAGEIVQEKEDRTCSEIAKQLLKKALENGSPDNVTVMVILLPAEKEWTKLPKHTKQSSKLLQFLSPSTAKEIVE